MKLQELFTKYNIGEIMKSPGVLQHIIDAERIGQKFDGIVSLVPAISFAENPILELDGEYYILFECSDDLTIASKDR